MHKNKIIIFICTILSLALLIVGESFEEVVLIESEESKTKELESVFNQIKWFSLKDKDVWMMNQSHFGDKPKKDKWERLAIVIDKTKKPMTAKYYQLNPGPLVWSENLIEEQVPFRASCFICHSNGPRAIRPVPHSKKAPLNLINQVQVALMNMRIKTYGRIQFDEMHVTSMADPPFYHEKGGEMDQLNVKSCTTCHQEDGFLSRGKLVRQQAGTIEFMVKNSHMPPPGFSLASDDRKKIQDFIRGF